MISDVMPTMVDVTGAKVRALFVGIVEETAIVLVMDKLNPWRVEGKKRLRGWHVDTVQAGRRREG